MVDGLILCNLFLIYYKIFKLIECRPLLKFTQSASLQSSKSDILLLVLDLGSAPDCPLFVDVLHHAVDVGGQQVVHLVAQRGLAEQLGALDKVAYGHVEVSVATGPVGDPGEWMSYQNVLQK